MSTTSGPDALWWAATTATTVGYGDRYPATGIGTGTGIGIGTGRLIGVGLTLCGLS